ncbi:MAG: chromate transporter [Ruminiclostridium sp.]
MNTYFQLFFLFFKVGLIGFGGGYAIIPIIEKELFSRQWLGTSQLAEIIAVSSMSPGPVAANCASLVGFNMSGYLGAVVACIGITLPSLLIILVLGKILFKYSEHLIVKGIFYGLRPAVTALIVYAAYRLCVSNNVISQYVIDIKSILIIGVAIIILWKTKINPIFILFGSAIIGMIIF